ncbi:hypothetical protein L1987_01668 [Smallanthus sonchifolius]|uniref:Uncharacterized protein n=1 Tax=Smallanthus sonchifolius TaxID=185202 RepID=A0ACB9K5V3_9ASTR|nr:hypothetical protein L1987_01668 [Smallanthus sonchifolius]
MKEPTEEYLMCEILWSDPQPNPGRGPSKHGVRLSFGGHVTKRFLKDNYLGKLILYLYLHKFCICIQNMSCTNTFAIQVLPT